MRRTLVLILTAVIAAAVVGGVARQATAAKPPLRLAVLSIPPAHPVAGRPWRFAVRVRRGSRAYTGAPPVLRGRGDTAMTVRTRRTGRAGDFAATVRFPTSGPWLLEVVVSRRRFVLGSFAVDVPVTELIRDPFAIAALPDGSLLIGQRDGPLLRADAHRAVSVFAPIANVTSVAPSGVATVLATDASGLHRLALDGTETSPPVALGAEAAVTSDADGSVYAAFYENRVERLGSGGERTVFAGTGEDGYAGDGGPARLAALSHPHDVAVGPGGDIFIADSGNGRIRRVDRSTGVITTFTAAVGPPIALAFAPDGSLYSVGLARGPTPPAIWRTTADGSTTIVAEGPANDVTVGPDGTVYVNQWEQKRIARIDQRTHLIRTILRGR